MKTETLDDIIGQYKGHGWILRRALLAGDDSQLLIEHLKNAYPGTEIRAGSESALWFSRRSAPTSEAWELRRISGSPFALLAVIDDSMPESEREAVLLDIQMRMFSGSHPEPTSH